MEKIVSIEIIEEYSSKLDNVLLVNRRGAVLYFIWNAIFKFIFERQYFIFFNLNIAGWLYTILDGLRNKCNKCTLSVIYHQYPFRFDLFCHSTTRTGTHIIVQ